MKMNWKTRARLAVEFDYQTWTKELEDLFPEPKEKLYWTVRLGRFALHRDGTWAYWARFLNDDSKQDLDYIRKQHFESLEDAIAVATKTFGKTPEHAIFQRDLVGSLRNEK